MSLFGSLFTGVSGLGAQSQSTAMIANNIANVNTVGFKRSEASFFSLVTTEGRSSLYSPGTVSVNRVQRVDLQGPIQQTASATDAAISGNGFFTVKRDTGADQEFLYTRSGAFSEDSQGLLRNTAGFVLYGWPLDSQGDLPANQGDLTSLVPVDVAFLGGLTRPTSSAELSLNLDASEGDENLVDATDDLTNPHFTRGLTVFDSLGQAQVLTFEFTKNYGPHATAGGTINDLLATDNLVTDLGLTATNSFDISSDLGGPLTLTVVAGTPALPGEVQTVNDIITEINNAGIGVEAFLGNDGELVIQRDEFAGGVANSLTLTNTAGTPLTALGITLVNGGGLGPDVFQSDDLAGAAGPLRSNNLDNGQFADNPPYSNETNTDTHTFPAFQFLPGDAQYNNRGWWQVNIVHPNGTSLSRGLINFSSDGRLNARPDSNGNIDINLTQIDWGNGSEAQSIDVDVERFSQFSGNYDVIFSDQNGAELGLRTGVEITRDGIIVARFSNGATSDLYKVPLVTFSNPNGLTEVSGTAYSENEESGEENLREAGRGGAGFLEPSTIETSNVDLADEFAKLIVSQRAFSANTRVINTVDQMTEDLLRLR
ncbi:MAG: flagellar hook-basal body complex protein [Rhodospirillales bacterium]|nr:flagellar hook-basal body complex protein [Rhodospirillales bacterium]